MLCNNELYQTRVKNINNCFVSQIEIQQGRIEHLEQKLKVEEANSNWPNIHFLKDQIFNCKSTIDQIETLQKMTIGRLDPSDVILNPPEPEPEKKPIEQWDQVTINAYQWAYSLLLRSPREKIEKMLINNSPEREELIGEIVGQAVNSGGYVPEKDKETGADEILKVYFKYNNKKD